ncbi:MAG TPA: MFS transporter [Solirubrobacteraceae bacterium]|jgi:MFS family permease|nr:MFS transporter [Solirubrobacteraceae bacterium]
MTAQVDGHGGAEAASGGVFAPQFRALTIGLVLTTTFIATEALSVLTIMPRVARDLGGVSLYGWVFSAFMLGSIVGAVAAGRDADRVGPARAYLVGLALFAGGLAVAGGAPSMAVLVIGRALQGLGAGAMPALGYVAIGRRMPERVRPQMMAMLSTAWVVPGLFGPVLSAGVTSAFGWRVVFLGLIPLVAIAGALALPPMARIGRPPPDAAASELSGVAEHKLSDALRTALGAALVLGALASGSAALAALLAVGGLVVGVPALRRLLPVGTLAARRGLPAAILSRGLLTFAFFGADAYVTLAFTTILHHSTTTTAVFITLPTLTWTLGSWLQARLSRTHEGKAFIRVGLGLLIGGIAGMSVCLLPGVPVSVAFISWSASGLGMGLAYAPTSLLTLRAASADRTGWASASLNLADVLGTALGTGIGGGALVLASNEGWSITTGVTLAFALAAIGALAGLAVTRRLPLQGLERARRAERVSWAA